MIEWIIIGTVVYLFGFAIIPIACKVFKGADPYVPSREYAEDFAARLRGVEESGSVTPSSPGGGQERAEPGDIVYVKLADDPCAHADGSAQRAPRHRHSVGRSACEKDRPLKLVP